MKEGCGVWCVVDDDPPTSFEEGKRIFFRATHFLAKKNGNEKFISLETFCFYRSNSFTWFSTIFWN